MLEFTLNKDDREQSLRPLLEAHISYEHMSARRSFCVHVLALVSVFVWVGVCWPGLLPAQIQIFADELWSVALFLALVAGVQEWKWHRLLMRYVADRPCAKMH